MADELMGRTVLRFPTCFANPFDFASRRASQPGFRCASTNNKRDFALLNNNDKNGGDAPTEPRHTVQAGISLRSTAVALGGEKIHLTCLLRLFDDRFRGSILFYCSCSSMDRTSASGAEDLGSTPGGSTTAKVGFKKSDCLWPFPGFQEGMSELAENNSRKIRVGVVGVGYLGQHHARIYHSLANECQLVGVVEPDDAKANAAVEAYHCRRYPDPIALAADCDALSVVVPTDLHAEVSIPLLRAGKHLLIEKPLCASLKEAQGILAAAQDSGTMVQVGHIEHFNPVMGYLEERVSHPRYITADRLAPFNPRGTEVGVVLDLMIHDIGIILQLVRSPIARVDAVGVKVLSGAEDIANARVVFENGCVANINTSRVSEKKLREIRVFQEDAYLSLDFMNQKGHLMRKGPSGLSREAIPIEKGEPLMLELRAFLASVRHLSRPRVDGRFGHRALEVALQVTGEIHRTQAAG